MWRRFSVLRTSVRCAAPSSAGARVGAGNGSRRGRHVPHGIGSALSRGRPDPDRDRRRFQDRPHGSLERAVPRLCRRYGLGHTGRTPSRCTRSPDMDLRTPGTRLHGLRPTARSRRSAGKHVAAVRPVEAAIRCARGPAVSRMSGTRTCPRVAAGADEQISACMTSVRHGHAARTITDRHDPELFRTARARAVRCRSLPVCRTPRPISGIKPPTYADAALEGRTRPSDRQGGAHWHAEILPARLRAVTLPQTRRVTRRGRDS